LLPERRKRAELAGQTSAMRKTIVVTLVLVLAFIGGAIWPFTALYDIATKAQARDVPGLTERIDFPALRRSLSGQIIRAYIRISGVNVSPTGVTAALAGSIADPIVEKLISPETLADLLGSGWPTSMAPERPPGLEGLSPDRLGSAWALFVNSEYGISGFSVSVPTDKPAAQQFRIYLALSRKGWRLSGLDMPDELVNNLTQQLISRRGIPSARN
jgi:hypothetical protein